MSSQEIRKIDVIEKLVRGELKQKKGAEILGVSVRLIKRLVRVYKQEGASGLAHKARGKTSNNKIAQARLDQAISIINERYRDFGPTLAQEKLKEEHDIKLSVERLRQEMVSVGLWSSRKRRKAQVHHLRERRSCFGELVQLDGSPHAWFEERGDRCNLNVMIDDATGIPMFRFSLVETTQDYFQILEEYLFKYGIPVALYADKHSIFRINKSGNLDHKKPREQDKYEGLTQFGRACQELGIELIYANTPQAKGRVERVNKTLQDRLVKELRLANISTIEEANQFLPKFTENFARKFSVKAKNGVDRHQKLGSNPDLASILCTKETRVLSKNLSFQYNNIIFQIKTKRSAYALRKTAITICERYDHSMVVLDNKGNTLEHTTIKTLPSTKTTNSKQLNQKLDAILVQEAKNNYKKRNHFDLSWEELGQEAASYRPRGVV